MKNTPRFLTFVLTIFTVLLGACSGTTAPVTGVESDKVQAMPVAFTGLVQSITGNQWVINDQALIVDPAVVRGGPFNVGDRIKLEGVVNQDGSFTVSRVVSASAEDASTLPELGNDNVNVNDNSNDANSNDDNGNNNDNDDDGNNNDNSNDDNSNDANSNDDDGNNNDNDDDGNNNDNSSDDNGGGGNDNSGNDDGGSGGGSDDGD